MKTAIWKRLTADLEIVSEDNQFLLKKKLSQGGYINLSKGCLKTVANARRDIIVSRIENQGLFAQNVVQQLREIQNPMHYNVPATNNLQKISNHVARNEKNSIFIKSIFKV